ncbi:MULTISPECIES: hypothetical protein [unclassified Nostoc]|uniref:hypothetical protein n=1 Tax=unclassified Nostoc TaxID=2593658 RepID=UPI002AD24BDE|nr:MULTISPECIES: hypothetical protein [unclassified Nostoc]MDZ8036011.1 hypothetical protein [Nostoc sp. DedSLP04]MDZ8137278.1 hypothetical protein [Nostoc sp. DedQUE04]
MTDIQSECRFFQKLVELVLELVHKDFYQRRSPNSPNQDYLVYLGFLQFEKFMSVENHA